MQFYAEGMAFSERVSSVHRISYLLLLHFVLVHMPAYQIQDPQLASPISINESSNVLHASRTAGFP